MELEQQIKIAVEGCDVMLYDIINTKVNGDTIYRVNITAKDGVTLDKCQEVSKMISPILDINEPIRGKYRLEVSSPGIERKLLNIDHFKGSIGDKVKYKNFSMEVFRGVLLSVEGEVLTFTNDEESFTINYDDVLSASTYYDWNN
ncbi:MAG TPA: ribosome maturation factor RimP [Arcobacter sp.]|nr:ribosome maturation factor RimP [Arcobacter sp.]